MQLVLLRTVCSQAQGCVCTALQLGGDVEQPWLMASSINRKCITHHYAATSWMDNIKTWTGLSVEESIRMTADRDKWRKYVRGVANPRIEDG